MELHPKYPSVFSPIRLGPVEIPTRYFFAPHGSALSAGSKPLTWSLVAWRLALMYARHLSFMLAKSFV